LGVINPILSTTIFERIPRELLGRVSSLTGTVAFAGIPLGGLAAGLLVTLVGPSPAVLACAVFYFAATTLPALRPEWREMDGRSARTQSPQPQRGRTVAGPGPVG
jgi:MFS family permease